jgi:prepilin-type N-terminal cleavage/methylation domain-containing protein
LNSRKAFTLIELLVVIAIIAILAAILFPVFAQAKLAAKKTVSVSNMKEIELAEKMYENDYDDEIPQSQYCTVTDPGANDLNLLTWQDEIYPYIKAGNHAADPTFGTGNGSDDRNKSSGIYADPGAPDHQSFPYGIHRHLAPDNWGTTCNGSAGNPLPGNSATTIPAPADTIMYMTKGHTEDGSGTGAGWGWIYFICNEWAWASSVGPIVNGVAQNDKDDLSEVWDCDGFSGNPVWGGCGMQPRYRYTRTDPVAFADGHVKAQTKGSIKWYKNIFVDGLASNDSGVW